MEVCERFRISHSHYLGGPAEWTPEDRALAQAYADWKRELCGDCGTAKKWWDPKQGGHRDAFLADTERCPGCEVKEQLRDQIPREQMRGVHIRLVPNPDLFPQEVTDDGR